MKLWLVGLGLHPDYMHGIFHLFFKVKTKFSKFYWISGQFSTLVMLSSVNIVNVAKVGGSSILVAL